MASIAFNKIGWVVLSIVAGVILIGALFFPNALFGTAKEAVGGVIDWVKENVQIGQDTLNAEETTIPQDIEEALTKLKLTMQGMITSSPSSFPDRGCFQNYKSIIPSTSVASGLPPLGIAGTQQAHLEIKKDGDDTRVWVYGGPGGNQYLDELSFTIEDMQPCVVAGETNGKVVAQEFIEANLDSTPGISSSNTFLPVEQINILYHDAWNEIQLPGWTDVNNEDNNMLDGGWLYTPDRTHLCFFPTIDASEGFPSIAADLVTFQGLNFVFANKKGARPELLGGPFSHSISNKVLRNELTTCYEESGFIASDTTSCAAGSQEGCHALGNGYLEISGQFAQGLTILEDNCNAGFYFSCRDVADLYATGENDLNPAEASNFYELACEKGDVYSCSLLGRYAQEGNTGLGIEENEEQALEFYIAACNLGESCACDDAGHLFSLDNDERAVTYYNLGCQWQSGDFCASACNNYAYHLLLGEHVAVDREKALQLYRISWEQGNDITACYRLDELGVDVTC
jgi:TPR repeat protein